MEAVNTLVTSLLRGSNLNDIIVGKSDVLLISSIFKTFDRAFDPNDDSVVRDLLGTYRKKRKSSSGLSPELKRIRLSQLSSQVYSSSQECIPSSQECIPSSQEFIPSSQPDEIPDSWPSDGLASRQMPSQNLFTIPESFAVDQNKTDNVKNSKSKSMEVDKSSDDVSSMSLSSDFLAEAIVEEPKTKPKLPKKNSRVKQERSSRSTRQKGKKKNVRN